MHIGIIIIFAVFLVISGLLIAKFHRNRSGTILILMMLVIAGMYWCDSPVRENVDMYTKTTHWYVIENQKLTIPLPPRTTLNYRSSSVQATYTTKSSIKDVQAFYNNLAEQNTMLCKQNANDMVLIFKYSDEWFSVSICDNANSRTIMVSLHNEDVSTQ